MNVKPLGTLIGMVLFCLPGAAGAQNSSPPPPPNPGEISAGPVIAAQAKPGAPLPPGPVVFQRRVVGPGGQESGVYLSTGTFGPGASLGAWWKNSETVSKLQLSEDQVRKIEQTYLDHKLKLIDLQADLEKQELRLQPLLDEDHPEEGKVGTQIDLITTARGRLEKENAMMMLAIRSQLSVEQWKKLKSMDAVERGKQNVFYWRGRGASPGGPGFNVPVPPPLPPPDDGPVTLPGPQ
jgi:periplasmic protein CpxP/Spy